MLAKPGDGGELDRVGRLVHRDPAQEEIRVDVEALPGGGEVRSHEQESRLADGADQGDVVLADHALTQVAGRKADLDPGRRPRKTAGRLRIRARDPNVGGHPLLDPRRHLLECREVGPNPFVTPDQLGGGERSPGAKAGVGTDELDRAVAFDSEGILGGAVPARPAPREGNGDSLRETPVDEVAHGSSLLRLPDHLEVGFRSGREHVVARVQIERRFRDREPAESEGRSGLANDQLAGGSVHGAAMAG